MRIVGTLFAMDMALVPVMVQDQHSHVDMEDPHIVEAGALLQFLFEATSWAAWAKVVLLVFVLHWAPIACHAFLCHFWFASGSSSATVTFGRCQSGWGPLRSAMYIVKGHARIPFSLRCFIRQALMGIICEWPPDFLFSE